MTAVTAGLAAAIGLVFILTLAPSGRAQNFDPAQKKAWDDLMAEQELNDSRKMEQIVHKQRAIFMTMFDSCDNALAFDDSLDIWKNAKLIGGLLDKDAANNEYAVRLTTIEKLSLEDRQRRVDLWQQDRTKRPQLVTASQTRDTAKMQELITQMQGLADGFQKLGDALNQAWCLNEVANAFRAVDQKVECAKVLAIMEDALKTAGFERLKLLVDTKSQLDGLRAEGAAPTEGGAGKGDPESGPSNNTATSWAKDEAGQRWSDPIPLKLVVDEKLPWGKITTPAFCNSENTQQWQQWVLRGNGPEVLDDRFRPMGLELKIKRDGMKILVDDNGDGKFREVKAIGKPNVVEIEKEFVDPWTKQPVKQQYAFLLGTGGQDETRFGLALNSSPQESAYLLRFAPASLLKGNILGMDVRLIDDNVTGRFGDVLTISLGSHLAKPTFPFTDAMLLAGAKVAQPYSEYLEVNGEFYKFRMSADDEAYSVKTRKLAIDSGTVVLDFKNTLKPEACVIAATGEFKGAYFNISGGKPVRVPVDRYKVVYGILRTGKKESQQSCVMVGSDEMVSFEVKKDAEVKIQLGKPFSFVFDTDNLGNGDIKVKGLSVAVKGREGERYLHFWDEPPIPEAVQLHVDGKAVGKPVSMKKATIEDWRKDESMIWGPLDVTLPGMKGTKYSVSMKLKKHDLLDGPIETKAD